MMHRKNNNAYNPGKILKVLIVSDGIIVDISSDKKVHKIVTELFMRGRKINISLIFILQSLQKIPKDVRQDTTYEKNSKQTRASPNFLLFNKLIFLIFFSFNKSKTLQISAV